MVWADVLPYEEGHLILVTILGQEYKFQVAPGPNGCYKGQPLCTCSESARLLQSHREALLALLAEATNIENVIEIILSVLTLAIVEHKDEFTGLYKGGDEMRGMDKEFPLIIQALNQLGWQYIQRMAPDFSQIELQIEFLEQKLQFLLKKSYLFDKSVNFSCICPKLDVLGCDIVANNWQEALENVSLAITDWNNLSQQVIEAKDLYTIQVLDWKVMIWLHSQEILVLTLISSHNHPFRWKWQPSLPWTIQRDRLKILTQWQDDQTICENISRLFSNSMHVIIRECAICFQLWLATLPPTVHCSSCEGSFHINCLQTWLERDPSAKSMFGRWRGNCPACFNSIEISII